MIVDNASTDMFTQGSSSYKKARKQYLKSNRNRPSGSSLDWTPFRAAEKKYMAKFPSPDLSDVLDLALLDECRSDEVAKGRWKGRADAIDAREITLKGYTGCRWRRAYYVPQIPGLVILPGYLNQELQRRLVRWSLAVHARRPNETNLDTHYRMPAEGLWNLHFRGDTSTLPRRDYDSPQNGEMDSASGLPTNPTTDHSATSTRPRTPPARPVTHGSATATELLPKLRWANIGWFYDWGTKEYEFSRGKPDVGEPIRSVCKEIVSIVDWNALFDTQMHDSDMHHEVVAASPQWAGWDSSYEPDAGIVNFYQYKDTLMGHVDRAEVCATSPLVSLSLGNAAVFLIGGPTKNDKPVAILLRSGDAIVMAGPSCRRAYHGKSVVTGNNDKSLTVLPEGVPRILEGTLPAHFDEVAESSAGWAAYSRYLQTTRINVNVRQVFPKGFDPSR
ncbi:hypothetical protein ACEPAF_4841 [Sanghuangporus sanghuang]